MRNPVPEAWFWLYLATFHAAGSAAALIEVVALDCPPRPVPWYTWAYFWLAFLALGITSYWVAWLYWDALWRRAGRLWAKLRGRDDSALK